MGLPAKDPSVSLGLDLLLRACFRYSVFVMPRRYVTTAIDYPNAAPHMGHVLSVKGKPSVFLSRALLSLLWCRSSEAELRFATF